MPDRNNEQINNFFTSYISILVIYVIDGWFKQISRVVFYIFNSKKNFVKCQISRKVNANFSVNTNNGNL